MVRTLDCERVKGVGNGKDPGAVRDGFTLEPPRIARTVEMLMVTPDDLGGLGKVPDVPDYAVTDLRVFAHHRLLVGVKRPGLVQDGVGHADLAYIMEQRAAVEVDEFPPPHVAGVRDDEGILGHPEGMVADLVLAGIDGVHKGLERYQVSRIDIVNNAGQVGIVEVTVLAPIGPVGSADIAIFRYGGAAVRAGMDVHLFYSHT